MLASPGTFGLGASVKTLTNTQTVTTTYTFDPTGIQNDFGSDKLENCNDNRLESH
jgi:hypothetical protein